MNVNRLAIFNDRIVWPDKCVKCYVREADTKVAMNGRYVWVEPIEVPYCRVCLASDESAFLELMKGGIVAFVPVVIALPLLFALMFMKRTVGVSFASACVFGGAIASFFVIMSITWRRMKMRRVALHQATVFAPIVVLRSYSNILWGHRRYDMLVANPDVYDFLVEHNTTRPD